MSVNKRCNKIGQVKIVIKCMKDHCVDVWKGHGHTYTTSGINFEPKTGRTQCDTAVIALGLSLKLTLGWQTNLFTDWITFSTKILIWRFMT